MRQAYDYWQDQPGSCLPGAPGRRPRRGRPLPKRQPCQHVQAPPKQEPEQSLDDVVSRKPRGQSRGDESQTRLARPTAERLPFLESSLRVPPARSLRVGDTGLSVDTQSPDRDSRKGGCVASSPVPLEELGLRTCTGRPGHELVISLHTVKRYKLLNRGCTSACVKRKGSPPPPGLTPGWRPLVSDREAGPRPRNRGPVSAHECTQSLISYKVRPDVRLDCGQSSQPDPRRALRWGSIEVPAGGSAAYAALRHASSPSAHLWQRGAWWRRTCRITRCARWLPGALPTVCCTWWAG